MAVSSALLFKRKRPVRKKLKNLVNVQAPLWYTESVGERRNVDMIMITGGSFQGKTDFAKSHFPDRERIVHFEEEILKCIRENKDPQKYTEHVIEQHPHAVVLMDEIGNGIVPVEKEERVWREAAGRAGCILAEHSEEVYRVMVGMGVRIK